MKDLFNRTIDYVRISVTEKCNFRCQYCMPHGEDFVQTEEMSDEELLSLCKAFAEIGIQYIKITGGEPLLRKNITSLIQQIKEIDGIKQVTLTTNGYLLEEQLEALKDAGIGGINISIDALDETLFHEITGVDKLANVLRAIEKSQELQMKNIKLNTVLMKNYNKSEYTKIAALAKKYPISIKFIEMMPIGHGKRFESNTLEELKDILEAEFGTIRELTGKHGNGPATYYTFDGFQGSIGMIGAMTNKFCKDCNRIRVTSDGFLKTCLHFDTGVVLKPYFGRPELVQVIKEAIKEKAESHKFGERDAQNVEAKLMSRIGG